MVIYKFTNISFGERTPGTPCLRITCLVQERHDRQLLFMFFALEKVRFDPTANQFQEAGVQRVLRSKQN